MLCRCSEISFVKSWKLIFDWSIPLGVAECHDGCMCGNCREMDTPVENVCCSVLKCVTNIEHFSNVCLDHMVLSVAMHN